ncbi:MAG: DALR domain-containing protein, partial [Pseudomonadota bacterium]
NPMDFVLWKPSGADEPGWESPWGLGRPGWHIECSVMSKAMLGDSFDIHGGGVDLVFPHHENERAQSLCAHPGSEFAKLWMHNGFVQVEGEKMSKSLGNFVTVHDLRDQAPGPAIRLAMLTTQYRQPFDWTRSLAQEATDTLERWSAAARAGGGAETGPDDVDAAFLEALSDDLNTPKALARLHELHREAAGAESARRAFIASAALLGLDLAADPVGAFRRGQAEARGFDAGQDALIERLLTRRLAARKAKDFAAADAIRDGLAAAGVEVKDTPGGFEHALGAGFHAAALAALAAAHLGEDALE